MNVDPEKHFVTGTQNFPNEGISSKGFFFGFGVSCRYFRWGLEPAHAFQAGTPKGF